jgi:DNA repair protein RecO (recombination protein O)
MEWRDEGIVIGARRLGESDVVLELMTRGHGRHAGLVRGGRSQRLQPILQAGNAVEAQWRARLDEHLGTFTVEATRLRAGALLSSAIALYGLGALGALLRLLPERDPHPALFEALAIVIEHLHDPRLAAPLLVRFEVALLAELGFGLDLGTCAATGSRSELVYVSPRTGRAVSRAAGEPWRERLLPLPAFLRPDAETVALPPPQDIADGFALTGHFLRREAFGPRGLGLPEPRAAFIAAAAVPEINDG